jgi:hypothetical protein
VRGGGVEVYSWKVRRWVIKIERALVLIRRRCIMRSLRRGLVLEILA